MQLSRLSPWRQWNYTGQTQYRACGHIRAHVCRTCTRVGCVYLRLRDTAEMLFFLERHTVARRLSRFITSYRESESSKSSERDMRGAFVVDAELRYKNA